MKNKLVIALIISLMLMSGTDLPVFAEEFKLFRSTKEFTNINVDISNITNEEQKAKKVAEEVLKRELGHGGDDEVAYKLQSIKNESGIWHVDYEWEYGSVPSGHSFNVKINFNDKIVSYQRCR